MMKVVLFDYFGVLSSNSYWQFVSENVENEEHFAELADQVNTGEINWDEFIEVVARDSLHRPEAVRAMYKSEQIDPRVVKIVNAVSKHQQTGLLTNAHHDFIEPILDKTGLSHLFNYVFVSSKIGFIKPSPQIFEHVIAACECDPEDILFIDDSPSNTAGAERSGLATILFTDPAQLERELKEQGVQFA